MLGVVVLKVDFRELEADWRQSNAPIFVTDEHGVVLLGSLPQWRFDVLAPLSEELAQRLRTSLQFGDARFQSVPISPPLQTSSTGTLVRADVALPQIPTRSPLLHTTLPITESPGWTLHLLSPVQSALNRASANAQLGALLAQSLLAAIVGVLLYRRHRGHEHTRQQTAIRQQLADQVHERTAQLRLANDRLLGEMDERQRAQARLHTLQDELVQASKLALLGQVAAGVAHEINQPVAAIRSYADNAAEFLRRQDPETARENLESIASLTERIGHITGELRAFSRKASTQVAPISLGAALDGALLLVGPRAARQGVALHRIYRRPGCAGAGRPHPAGAGAGQSAAERAGRSGRSARRCITLALRDQGERVQLYFHDNGPGLSAEALAGLFTPFHTTKPEGLGLGLVISRDIVAEFGGELRAADATDPEFPAPHGPGRGALFILTLRKASPLPAS
ncbi:ATP-binding protein [Achromobacter xylosoxidans]